jgi:hypothetical protein
MRATVDFCLWGFPNATSTISSPCDIDYACLPLKKALTYGNLNPSEETQWGYCSADNGSFLGVNLSPCIQCFQASKDEEYIANCKNNLVTLREIFTNNEIVLIALQAGCEQRPVPGQVIGLEGNIFSKTIVNITAAPTPSTTSTPQKTGIQTGTLVGIAVGAVLVFVAVISIVVICFRKRQAARRGLKELKSDYDTRYGANEISGPISGGFAEPPSPGEKDRLPEYERRAQQMYGVSSLPDEEPGPRANSARSNYTAAWAAKAGHQSTIPTHPAYLAPDQMRTPPLARETYTPPLRPSTRNNTRQDDVEVGVKRTTFQAKPDTRDRSQSSQGKQMHSPGLPETPKGGFKSFGLLSRLVGPKSPAPPPRTPHDIWN